MLSLFFLVFVFIILLLALYYFKRKQSPPGPVGVPIFGNFFSLGHWSSKTKHHQFYNYMRYQAKMYGELSSIQLGQQKYIIFSSIDVVKEAYLQHGDVFSGRPTNAFFRSFVGNNGVVSIDGEKWKNQRRFCLHTLRNFGLGKQSIEPAVIEEAEYIVNLIKDEQDRPVSSASIVVKGVANIISILLFNKRWEYHDTKLVGYIKALKALTNFSESPNYTMFLPLFFPFLAKRSIMLRLPGMSSIITSSDYMKSIIREEIESHINAFQIESEPKDMVETFLQEMTSNDERFGKGNHYFDIEQLVGLCWDLFSAGIDTTTNSLSWAFYILSKYPHVQEKLIKEIDEHIPLGRTPSMADKMNLIYVQAFIDEVHRFCTVTPLLVSRRVMQPFNFRGYQISTKDLVVVNTTDVHRHPKFFKDPDDFKPERFIDKDGSYKSSENVIPFGMGKRQCLGESLARMENFLILVYIMQRYRVDLDPKDMNRHEDIMSGTDGIIHSPGEHSVIFRNRV